MRPEVRETLPAMTTKWSEQVSSYAQDGELVRKAVDQRGARAAEARVDRVQLGNVGAGCKQLAVGSDCDVLC